MNEETVEKRVSALERAVQHQVTIRDLAALQSALSGHIVQLGVEMRVGFSALREEIHAGDEETRRVLREESRAGDEETRRVLREESRAGNEETRRVLREEIRAGDEETRRVLREEIRAGDEETRGLIEQRTAEILAVVVAGDAETRQHAQLLHEEVSAQIRTIRNG